MKQQISYIGVTGITKETEVWDISKMKRSLRIKNLMLGILVSYKVLDKGYHPSKLEYPPLDQLPSLLKTIRMANEGNIFSTIHYNSKNPSFSDDIHFLMLHMNLLDFVDGIQLNITYPDLDSLKTIHKTYPDLALIFQINKKMLSDYKPSQICDLIKNKYNMMDYILIDPSMGRGKDINLENALSLYSEIKKRLDKRVGFAGGFSHLNIRERMKFLLTHNIGVSEFSIDAQSKLRETSNSALDLDKVYQYLSEYKNVLTEQTKI